MSEERMSPERMNSQETDPASRERCCEEVRQESLDRIYSYLDGELSSAELQDIKAHLDACVNCNDEYEVESLLKELVRRSCSRDRAPDGLKERIKARIEIQQTVVIRRTIG